MQQHSIEAACIDKTAPQSQPLAFSLPLALLVPPKFQPLGSSSLLLFAPDFTSLKVGDAPNKSGS